MRAPTAALARARERKLKTRSTTPGLHWERRAWSSGKTLVAGVDEVGRGAWAGPVVAAAIILPESPQERARLTRALRGASTLAQDSKRLTPEQRQRVAEVIRALDIPHSIAEVPAQRIDEIGLAAANREALAAAVAGLTPTPDHVLVDAFRLPGLTCSHQSIVRGDSVSTAIALASTIAKAARDALMCELCSRYPEYGFSAHKGYGTAMHRAALERFGPCEIHRMSFQPVHALVSDA